MYMLSHMHTDMYGHLSSIFIYIHIHTIEYVLHSFASRKMRKVGFIIYKILNKREMVAFKWSLFYHLAFESFNQCLSWRACPSVTDNYP